MKIRIISLLLALAALVSGLIIKNASISEVYSEQSLNKETEQDIVREVQIMKLQMGPVLDKIENAQRNSFSVLNIDTKYPYYIYKRSRLYYWSDYRFVPNYNQLVRDYINEVTLISFSQGHFLVKKWSFEVNGEEYEAFGFIPLLTSPNINNEFIYSKVNGDIFREQDIQILYSKNEGIPITLEGNYLFSVEQESVIILYSKWPQFFALLLIVSGLLVCIILVHRKSYKLAHERRVEVGFALVVSTMLAIRAFMLVIEFPNSFANWILFDPIFFASSEINPTIGDLLINTLVVFYLAWYLFRNYHKSPYFIRFLSAHYSSKFILSVILVIISFLAISYPHYIFKIFYNNPQWSLDITSNINFSLMKIIYYLVLIISASIFFILYHIIYRVISKFQDRSIYGLILSYSTGALIFIAIANQLQWPFVVAVILNTVHFFPQKQIWNKHQLSSSLIRS